MMTMKDSLNTIAVLLAGTLAPSGVAAFALPHLRNYHSMTAPMRLKGTFARSAAAHIQNDDCVAKKDREVHTVDIFESILRDGEQGAKKTFDPKGKGEIARCLEKVVGMKLIDAGMPGASPLDYEGVRSVVGSTNHATLSVLAHGTRSEIALAAKSLHGAEKRSRIATFHRPMEISSRHTGALAGGKHSLIDVQRQLLKRASLAVRLAADMAPEVQYYLVYAGNRDPNFLAELAHAVSNAGATQVAIADSQSAFTPTRAHLVTTKVKEAVKDKTIVAIHAHNQMGLALPNALAAVAAGATQVESCLLGLGDAGGNLSTEQFLAYCNHSFGDNADDEEMFPACDVDGVSLSASTLLAAEVAQATKFVVGENQPIVGERSFFCTMGIHQNNVSHLGHTRFDPELAGRQWSVGFNRHSSKSAVSLLLQKHDRYSKLDGDGENKLVDAVYSYLSHQLESLGEDAILLFCDHLLKAYSVLKEGGVLISPTTVGYTLIASGKAGIKRMKSIKGREDKKPCGILGVPGVYRATFGEEPPLKCRLSENHILAYMGRPEGTEMPRSILSDAIGPNGEVGIWLNNGPMADYLASQLWSERQQVIVATSCNRAGDGNPRSTKYALSHVNAQLRSMVDMEIDIAHWERPELDKDGRWLSAPIWNMDTGEFVRQGRGQHVVSEILMRKGNLDSKRNFNQTIRVV